MKVMVVGSRNIESFDISEYIPADAELIISGGFGGLCFDCVGRCFERYNAYSQLCKKEK